MVKKLLKILSIALIYCGALFGAGFASGREIFTFFSCYKTAGIVVSVFAGFLFSFFGFFVCGYAKTKNITNPEKYYEELFPKAVSKVTAFFTSAFLVMSFSIMITGCGTLLSEQLGVSSIYGSLVSLILCFFVIRNDVLGLERFNLLATPFMLVGVIVLCLLSLKLPEVSDTEMGEVIPAAISGILYVSYNMVSAVAVMVSSSKIAQTPKDAAIGGAVGGIFVAVPLVLMSVVLGCHWEVASMPLPFFNLIYNNFPKVSFVCSLVLYIAMLTTATSSGVAALSCTKGKSTGKWAYLLCFFAFFMSFIPFGTLVQTVYTGFGFIGIILVVGIFIKILRK